MFQTILNLLSSAYVEIIILILLLIGFIIHRKDPRLVSLGHQDNTDYYCGIDFLLFHVYLGQYRAANVAQHQRLRHVSRQPLHVL